MGDFKMSDKKVVEPLREILTKLCKKEKGLLLIGDLDNKTRLVVYGAKAFAEDMQYSDSLAYRLIHGNPKIKKIFQGEKE